MSRRFYVFNNLSKVKDHIAQVKTLMDLAQLNHDIKESETNLTRFKFGAHGVYAVDCAAGEKPFRHVFLTKDAYDRLGEPTKEEADSYTVLSD